MNSHALFSLRRLNYDIQNITTNPLLSIDIRALTCENLKFDLYFRQSLVDFRHWQPVHNHHPLSPKPLHRLDRLVMPKLLRLLIRNQHKVVLEQLRPFLDAVLLRQLGRHCLERHDERILHAKDGVGRFVV